MRTCNALGVVLLESGSFAFVFGLATVLETRLTMLAGWIEELFWEARVAGLRMGIGASTLMKASSSLEGETDARSSTALSRTEGTDWSMDSVTLECGILCGLDGCWCWCWWACGER